MAAATMLSSTSRGEVCSIDQTDNYQVRSSREHVLGAVQAAFGPASLAFSARQARLARQEGRFAPCYTTEGSLS